MKKIIFAGAILSLLAMFIHGMIYLMYFYWNYDTLRCLEHLYGVTFLSFIFTLASLQGGLDLKAATKSAFVCNISLTVIWEIIIQGGARQIHGSLHPIQWVQISYDLTGMMIAFLISAIIVIIKNIKEAKN
ncbi:MAG: hypothetical protein ACOYMB_05495 [Patescibacteria group bacterium]